MMMKPACRWWLFHRAGRSQTTWRLTTDNGKNGGNSISFCQWSFLPWLFYNCRVIQLYSTINDTVIQVNTSTKPSQLLINTLRIMGMPQGFWRLLLSNSFPCRSFFKASFKDFAKNKPVFWCRGNADVFFWTLNTSIKHHKNTIHGTIVYLPTFTIRKSTLNVGEQIRNPVERVRVKISCPVQL